jgi:hypothetical protein
MLDEVSKLVKARYGLLGGYVTEGGRRFYVVAAEPELRAIPEVVCPEHGIAILASEVIELARGAITIEALVRRKNPELFPH